MKTSSIITIVVALLLAGALPGKPQGTFVNLDFESPILPLIPDPDFSVPITNALPGWRGYIGTQQTFRVAYNALSLGAASISIHDSSSSSQPIDGNYSVILQPSFGGPPTTAGIGQTGVVPSDARSLIFFSGSESMQVAFDGQPLPLVQLGSSSSYLILAADVSSLAGQTGELRFTMPVVLFSFNLPYLDNIQFSPEAIPEPSVISLLTFGVLFLGWGLRRK